MDTKQLKHLSSPRNAVTNNGLFAVLSVIGAGLSYLLYPVLTKFITPTQFGDVSVVIALAGQIGGLLLAFNVVSIYIVNTRSREDAIRLSEIIQKVLIQVLLVAMGVVLLLAPWLQHSLHLSGSWTILALGSIILLSVPAVVWTGYLQGHNELARIGAYNAVSAAAKLGFAAALSLLGWGAVGAVLGVIVGQLLGLWLIKAFPGTELPAAHKAFSLVRRPELGLIRPLAGYVTESVVVVGAFSLLFAVDIIIAKMVFPPHAAGVYAGMASLGRVVFYGASILTWIMLAKLESQDIRHNRRVLARYLGLIALMGGVVVAAFWIGRDPIIRLSLGPAYLAVRDQLWLVGLSQLVSALLYTYTLYLLVLRRSWPAYLAVIVASLAVTLGAFHPTNPASMLMGLIIGQVAGWAVFAVVVSAHQALSRKR